MVADRKERLAQFRARAVEALKAHGLRITGPRLEVVKVLADSEYALTPYQIHTKVMESGGHIDVVSVYRILNAFQPIGLVHHIGAVDGFWACSMPHESASHSQHLVCKGCSRVVELSIDDQIVGDAIGRAEAQGFGPPIVQLEVISEYCDRCRPSN